MNSQLELKSFAQFSTQLCERIRSNRWESSERIYWMFEREFLSFRTLWKFHDGSQLSTANKKHALNPPLNFFWRAWKHLRESARVNKRWSKATHDEDFSVNDMCKSNKSLLTFLISLDVNSFELRPTSIISYILTC